MKRVCTRASNLTLFDEFYDRMKNVCLWSAIPIIKKVYAYTGTHVNGDANDRNIFNLLLLSVEGEL